MTTLRLNPLLLDLYACPTDSGRWPTVLDQLCRSLRVRSAVVQLLVRDGNSARARWMVRDSTSEAARAIHDRYFSDDVNPRMQPRRSPPWDQEVIVRDRDFFEPDDPLYLDLQQRLSAARLGRFVSVRLPFSESEALALVLHRDFHDHEDFNRREERFALELMPHLRQAVQLSMTLHDASRHACDLRETVNSMRCGLILCHADSTVSWMNCAAERMLAERRALWVHNEKLTTAAAQETTTLRRSIFAMALEGDDSAEPEYLALGGQSGKSAVHVKMRRIEQSSDCMRDPRPRVLLMLSDPNDVPALPAEVLRRLFGLSPAESRLAAALCSGATLNEYAQEHQVSVGTARYQLKQVMAKTQVSRQAELIQRLYSSVIAQALN